MKTHLYPESFPSVAAATIHPVDVAVRPRREDGIRRIRSSAIYDYSGDVWKIRDTENVSIFRASEREIRYRLNFL